MKLKIIIIFIFSIFILLPSVSKSEFENNIIAKIGNKIITNYDLINEINTILALSNEVANQENLKSLQSIALSSLKKKLVKEIEIERLNVKDFNKSDLNNYIKSLERDLKLNNLSLKDHFQKYNANYDVFTESVKINLKWNTLIYSIYQKELYVDEAIIETNLAQEINKNKKIDEYNLSEIVIENYNQEKIETIQLSIKNKGFEKTASLFSSSVTSSKGGLIGWISSKSISKSYRNEINKLNIGEISNPILNNNILVIIKLNNKRTLNKSNLDLERMKVSVINKKKEEMLRTFSNSHYLDLEKRIFIEY